MQTREAIAAWGAEAPAGVDGPAAPSWPATASAFCTRCTASVSLLPRTARFCSRCGLPLPQQVEQPEGVPQNSGADTISSPPATEPFRPPAILLAYARALFNLGNRYETAVGSRRNLQEAARCYWKAARLGDGAARERVETQPEHGDALPYKPPPLPLPGSLIVRDPSPPFAAVYRPDIS